MSVKFSSICHSLNSFHVLQKLKLSSKKRHKNFFKVVYTFGWNTWLHDCLQTCEHFPQWWRWWCIMLNKNTCPVFTTTIHLLSRLLLSDSNNTTTTTIICTTTFEYHFHFIYHIKIYNYRPLQHLTTL